LLHAKNAEVIRKNEIVVSFDC